MLEARGLAGARNGQVLFQDLALDIAPGEVVGIAGPSGCGKSTLGRILAGYLAPVRGHVRVDGRNLPRRGICPVQYVPQHPLAAVNPTWPIRRILAESHEPAPDTLARLGVDPAWGPRLPATLSGGQLQRVVLARALVPAAQILVMDEATASLDAISQAEIWTAIACLRHRRGLGIVAISHDEALLRRVADRTLHLPDYASGPAHGRHCARAGTAEWPV